MIDLDVKPGAHNLLKQAADRSEVNSENSDALHGKRK